MLWAAVTFAIVLILGCGGRTSGDDAAGSPPGDMEGGREACERVVLACSEMASHASGDFQAVRDQCVQFARAVVQSTPHEVGSQCEDLAAACLDLCNASSETAGLE